MKRSTKPLRLPLRLATLACILLLAAACVGTGPHAAVHAAATITGLHVQGNQIVDGNGQPLRLLGVDRSGTEYACIQGWGFFDGPSDAASVQAIASWHVNAVRVPLNEDCWLNINGSPAAYSGSAYQQAVGNYVNLLNQYGMVAILDLHWNAAGTSQATGQQPMPDRDHAPAFWSSVASYFKGNSSVIFDLYNEPYPDSNQSTTAAWQCWRDGGTCPGVSFTGAGMQELVNAVRNVGANNIIMLGGVEYSNNLSQWLTYKPSDPQNNLAASWHSYNFNLCNTQSCWDSTIAPVAQQVPLVAGEIGENDCAHGYIDTLMPWMDSHGASYLGWTWDTWNCSSGPALISDYTGTPTNFGVGFRDHLASLAGSSPTATSTPVSATSTPTPTATATATATPTSSNALVIGNFENTTDGFVGNSDITNLGPSNWAPTVALGSYSLWTQYDIPSAWSEVQLYKAVNLNLSAYTTLSVSVYPKQPTVAGPGVKVRFMVQGSNKKWYYSTYQSVPIGARTTLSWNMSSVPRSPMKQIYVCWQYTTADTGTGNELWVDDLQAS